MAAKTMPATAIQEETNNREAEHKKADRLIHFMSGGGGDVVNVTRNAAPTWSMAAARAVPLGQCCPRPGPTWSMLSAMAGRIRQCWRGGGATLSMLPAGPVRLGHCWPPWGAAGWY